MIHLSEDIHLISMTRGAASSRQALLGRRELGGKASGLFSVSRILAEIAVSALPGVRLDIPEMTVIGTSVFDAFMARNRLDERALADLSDERIANTFLRADMPFEILGELRALVNGWSTPLAVRSSGLLEDTTHRPFAGVYLTKMIPNNALEADVRFQKLVEAVKFVWASTFFKIARDYCRATGLRLGDEKMAVIIQEVVGRRRGERFYPELSGVARSYNYYPLRPAQPEDGVVNLALGLGKTIVDGGKCWIYSPAYPAMPPPFESPEELLRETQTAFWAIHMGEPPAYDPLREAEYLRLDDLAAAEQDGVLDNLVSTYDPQSGRLSMGSGGRGPRALTFAPLLALNEIPFNRILQDVLLGCQERLGYPVEIEFAMTCDPLRFGFLQVRPMVVPQDDMQVTEADLQDPAALVASESVLGNGAVDAIKDVVYVMPERFDLEHTRRIADELDDFNRLLLDEGRPYLLIVFGRLGTLDPWLGIPVTWGQICGARVIVEATQDNVRVELSQGSHYFHNIINLGVLHFSMPFSAPHRIRWEWLEGQPSAEEKRFTRRVRLDSPLRVVVDGRRGRGVVRLPDVPKR